MSAKDKHKGTSNGVTQADSAPSGTNVPHDMTSTNAIEHVLENDGKEMNAHEIGPSHDSTCISSILRKAAIYPHAVNNGCGNIQFEIDEGPKLEEWIPEPYLPEVLVVYDPDGVTSYERDRPPMRIYKRKHHAPASTRESKEGDAMKDEKVLPCVASIESDPTSRFNASVPFNLEKTPTAQLFLSGSRYIGSGHHSHVYRASLRLPAPLYARDSRHNVVSVAAKLCKQGEESLMNNEAKLYAGFKKHLAEEWCGFNKVDGVTQPVRAKAVVPKFYGYYLPEKQHDDEPWYFSLGSPILLLEECGRPVEPGYLTRDQRCVLLFLHVHLQSQLESIHEG
jgi:hypothetical protein